MEGEKRRVYYLGLYFLLQHLFFKTWIEVLTKLTFQPLFLGVRDFQSLLALKMCLVPISLRPKSKYQTEEL
jgi:hypothetical protein